MTWWSFTGYSDGKRSLWIGRNVALVLVLVSGRGVVVAFEFVKPLFLTPTNYVIKLQSYAKRLKMC
jgi:hypothetical protein